MQQATREQPSQQADGSEAGYVERLVGVYRALDREVAEANRVYLEAHAPCQASEPNPDRVALYARVDRSFVDLQAASRRRDLARSALEAALRSPAPAAESVTGAFVPPPRLRFLRWLVQNERLVGDTLPVSAE